MTREEEVRAHSEKITPQKRSAIMKFVSSIDDPRGRGRLICSGLHGRQDAGKHSEDSDKAIG